MELCLLWHTAQRIRLCSCSTRRTRRPHYGPQSPAVIPAISTTATASAVLDAAAAAALALALALALTLALALAAATTVATATATAYAATATASAATAAASAATSTPVSLLLVPTFVFDVLGQRRHSQRVRGRHACLPRGSMP
jgi:hypothetical protein